jgi:hypothetical protein
MGVILLKKCLKNWNFIKKWRGKVGDNDNMVGYLITKGFKLINRQCDNRQKLGEI